MIVAFDTFRYPSFAYTVGAVFDSWGSDKVRYYVTSKKELKKNEGEIHYILECLKTLNSINILRNNISAVVVNGFVWSVDEKDELIKGFGALLKDSVKQLFDVSPTILGISEKPYSRDIPYSVEITRGTKDNKGSLWITSSEYFLTDYDAMMVEKMSGSDIVPDIIKDVRMKAREFLKDKKGVGK